MQNKVLQLKDLTKFPLICLGKETKTNEFFSRFFMSHGLVFLPDMEAATTDQILPMVRNNLGLGFLPDIFAEPAIEMGAIYGLKLQEKIPKRDICLLKNTERPLSIAAKELEKMLLASFDFRPAAIIEKLDLRRPIYKKTAAYGHFGRDDADFPWEKVDLQFVK